MIADVNRALGRPLYAPASTQPAGAGRRPPGLADLVLSKSYPLNDRRERHAGGARRLSHVRLQKYRAALGAAGGVAGAADAGAERGIGMWPPELVLQLDGVRVEARAEIDRKLGQGRRLIVVGGGAG